MMFQDQQGTQGLNNRINQTGQSRREMVFL